VSRNALLRNECLELANVRPRGFAALEAKGEAVPARVVEEAAPTAAWFWVHSLCFLLLLLLTKKQTTGMATAVHKKQSESKYVTCFADSRPDVDVTFRDVLLGRPTDHYLVGVDNFSMTNTTLSMIEPRRRSARADDANGSVLDEALIRIVKRQTLDGAVTTTRPNADALDTFFQGAPRNLTDLYIRKDGVTIMQISSQEKILSVQQLMHRLEQLASDMTAYMSDGSCLLDAANHEFGGYNPVNLAGARETDVDHLRFEVATDGRLQIVGTKAFWANFAIEVPAIQNQFGLFGERGNDTEVDFTRLRRFLTIDPKDLTPSFARIQVNSKTKSQPKEPVRQVAETGIAFAGRLIAWRAACTAVNGFNSRTLLGRTPKFHIVQGDDAPYNLAHFNTTESAVARETISYSTRSSIFSSMERRVALEIGCSLPIKNSPMVDHQKETPDFVLGRWIWRTDPRIECNEMGGSRRYAGAMPSCTEYQGARDRISYHELQPQAKIQTLRIKLFARLRTFDDSTETYGMRIIQLPTGPTDWWTTRLHFMSKD
jgi:hypothetical protein